MSFSLDHRLADSSFEVEDWALCRVCLKNDKTLPWLYLVPMREGVREFSDLAAADQQTLMVEMARAQKALQALYAPDKLNTAALGNMVPQLHIHIFGRFQNDFAWPKPVWAAEWAEQPYTDAERDSEITRLREYFSAGQTRTTTNKG